MWYLGHSMTSTQNVKDTRTKDSIQGLPVLGFRHALILEDLEAQVLSSASENVFVPLTVGGGIRDFMDSEGRQYSALEVAAAYFRC